MKKQIYILGIGIASFMAIPALAQNNPSLTVGDTGTVSFTYQGSNVTYTTVRAADGKVWFQQNMGASNRAATATDITSYGDLFQWGRWDDGHQLRNSGTSLASGLTLNNPAGLSGGTPKFLIGNNPTDWWGAGTPNDSWMGDSANTYNGIDPCTAVGAGWHLPTVTEWGNVITLESVTNITSGFSSNLKLPAAGMREPINGNLVNVGTAGNYWSNSTSGVYAKDVTILSGSVNPSDDALRSYGFSLRCMLSCPTLLPPLQIEGEDTVCAESTHLYYVPANPNVTAYLWTVPAGWNIVGPSNNDSVMIKAGSTNGMVRLRLTNACEDTSSITALSVVITALNPVITASGNVLSTGTFTTYQWLLNNTLIAGATGATHTAATTGLYRVIVTNASGCKDTSAAYNFGGVGINSPESEQAEIYPNPAKDRLQIRFQTAVTGLQIRLTDLLGRTVLTASGDRKQQQTYNLSLRSVPQGTYILHLQTNAGQIIRKIQVIR